MNFLIFVFNIMQFQHYLEALNLRLRAPYIWAKNDFYLKLYA